MIETILRNTIALASTFIVIVTIFMIVSHVCIYVFTHKKELSTIQEKVIFLGGILLAMALIPFYYLPY